ncbi:MAG: hypothetical protein AB7S44_03395 [Spirochaetales bacterium]
MGEIYWGNSVYGVFRDNKVYGFDRKGREVYRGQYTNNGEIYGYFNGCERQLGYLSYNRIHSILRYSDFDVEIGYITNDTIYLNEDKYKFSYNYGYSGDMLGAAAAVFCIFGVDKEFDVIQQDKFDAMDEERAKKAKEDEEWRERENERLFDYDEYENNK